MVDEAEQPADAQPAGPTDLGTVPALSLVETARYLSVSPRTLMRWIGTGAVPSPTYFGRRARYSLAFVKHVNEHGISKPGTFTPAQGPNKDAHLRAKAAEVKKARPKRAAAKKSAVKGKKAAPKKGRK